MLVMVVVFQLTSMTNYHGNINLFENKDFESNFRRNKRADYKQSNVSIPSTASNGTVIRASMSHNSNLGYGGYPQRIVHNINEVKRSATGERIAPIAQAECSDTDFESARSPAAQISKQNNGEYIKRGNHY